MEGKQEGPTVVVVGGGIIGCSTAMQLATRNAKVILIERCEIACAASGKAGGFLAREWGSGPTVQLHRKSFDMHKALAKEHKIASFRELPTLSVKTMGRLMKGATKKCEWLDGHVSSVGMMDPSTAQVTPKEISKLFAKIATENGAEIIKAAVSGVARADGCVTSVKLENGKEIKGDSFVFCMGPWTVKCEAWFPELSVPMVGIYSSSLIFKYEAGTVAPFALFCGESDDGTHLEVYPRPEGDVYVCGCGGSKHLPRREIEKLNPEQVVPDPKRVEVATKAFARMTPTLGKDNADVTQACMRPCTDDGMPMMGIIPGEKNCFVATGHNCWGILWGPVTGLAMSELVLKGKSSTIDLSPFSPARFQKRKIRRSRQMGDGETVGEDW
mmetsp:Transcript_12353/g.17158  ORF Transcript_12353/g.17158 Transcript_12353/m.17158 type:complete len:385 (-) Transcript_12353:86-1240(-)